MLYVFILLKLYHRKTPKYCLVKKHLTNFPILSYLERKLSYLTEKIIFISSLIYLIIFVKWANPSLCYYLFSVFSNKHHYNFYSKLI